MDRYKAIIRLFVCVAVAAGTTALAQDKPPPGETPIELPPCDPPCEPCFGSDCNEPGDPPGPPNCPGPSCACEGSACPCQGPDCIWLPLPIDESPLCEGQACNDCDLGCHLCFPGCPCDGGTKPGCPPPPPCVRAELVDCEDNVLQSKQFCTDGSSDLCSGNPVPGELLIFFDPSGRCDKVPTKIVITPQTGTVIDDEGSQTCEAVYRDDEDAQVVKDLPAMDMSCSARPTQADLDCYASEGASKLTNADILLYKRNPSNNSVSTLYTLPDCVETDVDSLYGETVNGEFRARVKGTLWIAIEGTKNGANTVVDVYGDGWMTGAGRGGSFMDETVATACSDWAADPSAGAYNTWKFSVRTYHGTAPKFKMTFHWYYFDADGCLVHEQEKLNVTVTKLRVIPSGQRTATPRLSAAIQTGEDQHFETQLPRCATCDCDGACTPSGDITDWFVTWPHSTVLPATGRISTGPARGWRIESSPTGFMLIRPDDDETAYHFDMSGQ